MSRGDAVRATAATDCNEHSSRSHSILSFHVESQRADLGSSSGSGASGVGENGRGTAGKASGGVRLGKLHLVDLAGRCDVEGFRGLLGGMNARVFTFPTPVLRWFGFQTLPEYGVNFGDSIALLNI